MTLFSQTLIRSVTSAFAFRNSKVKATRLLAKEYQLASQFRNSNNTMNYSTLLSVNSSVELNLGQVFTWSKEEACSLLCSSTMQGGAGFPKEAIQSLYDAGFDGIAFANIIADLSKAKNANIEAQSRYPYVNQSLMNMVVNFVSDLVETKRLNINVDMKFVIPPSVITKENMKGLKFILESKDGLPISQEDLLLSSFGKDFKLVERQEIIETIIENFAKRKEQGHLDKKDVVFPFVAAAPGIGKSRLLKEVAIHTRMNSIRKGITTIPILITIGNGLGLQESEKDILQAIIVRMIFSALTQKSGSIPRFSSFLTEWNEFSRMKKYTLEEAFIIISSILEWEEEHIDFFLAIDEAHNLESHDTKLRQAITELGSYISLNNSPYKLYVMFAGTYFTPIYSSLLCSSYTPQFIPLKSGLSRKSVKIILNDLSEKYSQLENWKTNVKFRQYLRRLSGFPRGIETFIENFIYHKTAEAAWIYTESFLLQKYKIGLNDSMRYYLAKCIFTKKSLVHNEKIPNSDNTFSDLENLGAIMINTKPNMDRVSIYPTILLEQLLSFNPLYLEVFNSIYYDRDGLFMILIGSTFFKSIIIYCYYF